MVSDVMYLLLILFVQVNTSGQFVGLAEMVGPVDFDKTVEYWQQDKWTGCFPVKWHIVKDIPNNLLKHIVLEYNENKPVTNSRDTQEVRTGDLNFFLLMLTSYQVKLLVAHRGCLFHCACITVMKHISH
jgi:hypothetical protein